MSMQQTLAKTVETRGVGLHCGATLPVVLKPSAAGTGIRFIRTDLAVPAEIMASASGVVDTRLATVVGAGAATLSTVEHIMAALWACGVDNAVIEVGGPEVPVMDGSSAPWVALIEDAGVVVQDAPRMVMVVTADVCVTDGDKLAAVAPADGFSVDCEIAFAHPGIGTQSLRLDLDGPTFRRDLARARTFGFAWEVEALRKAGLARGGSLENAVVVDESGVVNPEGLRFEDEFVRHKVLDAVGDLFLMGAHLQGRVTLRKAGHALHNKLCRALLESGSYVMVPATELPRAPRRVARAPQRDSTPPSAAA